MTLQAHASEETDTPTLHPGAAHKVGRHFQHTQRAIAQAVHATPVAGLLLEVRQKQDDQAQPKVTNQRLSACLAQPVTSSLALFRIQWDPQCCLLPDTEPVVAGGAGWQTPHAPSGSSTQPPGGACSCRAPSPGLP